MSRTRRNIVANYLGKAWLAIMSLAFIPVYIRLMGVEAYGLVGFYVSLAAVLSFMELGMGTTLNRELARFSGRAGEGAEEVRDLLRSFEWLVWGGGLLLVIGVWMAAPWIGGHWLRAGEGLTPEEIAGAIALMGTAIALRLPFQVYSGGLCGLQHQGLYNLLLAIGATLRSGGVVLVLLWSPTITAFFAWYIAIEALMSLLAAVCLWRVMPGEGGGRFRLDVIRPVWSFSLGMMVLSILLAIVGQMDKFMVGRFLSLEMLGYYSVAVAVVSGLYYIAYPINTAIFPRFSELFAACDKAGLSEVFEKASRLIASLVFPAVFLLILFPDHILMSWTGDREISQHTSAPLALLAVGVGLNVSLLMPVAVMYAGGMLRPQVVINILLVPALWLALPALMATWGLNGAAIVVALVNLVYLVVYLPILLGILGAAVIRSWLLSAIVLPAIVIAVPEWGLSQIAPAATNRIEAIFVLVIVSPLAWGLSYLVCWRRGNDLAMNMVAGRR